MSTDIKHQVDVDSFWLPNQSSTIASEIDAAWDAAYWVSLAFFFVVIVPMVYFAWKYRRRSEHDKTSDIDHSTTVEVVWSVIPLIICGVLFFVGLRGYVNASVAPAEAMEVQVTAKMYMWTFTYPNGTTTVNELGVPKGKPVKLIMSSGDVLHSFFVPEFRVKNDVVPGLYTTLWFEATEAKELTVFCTEYCGTGHSGMLAKVLVMEPPKFKEWLDNGGSGSDLPPLERGKQLFATRSCNTCHSVEGGRIQGPPLNGLFGRSEKMADGSTIVVDENYIRESLLDPQAKIVEGYPSTMPTYRGLLKDKDIDALIAYFKSLN